MMELKRIVETVRFYDHDDCVVFAPDDRSLIFDVTLTTSAWYALGSPGTLTVDIVSASAPARRENAIP